MRMLLKATALALAAAGTALASFPMRVGYGIMPRANGNLQNFTDALGGVDAEPITSTGDSTRPFAVDGETFTSLSAAVSRSCSIQHTGCSNAANAAGDGKDGGFTVGMCDSQQTSCLAGGSSSASNGSSATTTTPATTAPPASVTTDLAAFTGTPQSSDANFFYFCDS